MRRTALLSVIFLSLVVVGCAGGYDYSTNKNLQAKIAVTVERQLATKVDDKFIVYANEFTRSDDVLIFKCPCYYVFESGYNTRAVAEVLSNPLKLRLMTGAPYIVSVRDLVSEGE